MNVSHSGIFNNHAEIQSEADQRFSAARSILVINSTISDNQINISLGDTDSNLDVPVMLRISDSTVSFGSDQLYSPSIDLQGFTDGTVERSIFLGDIEVIDFSELHTGSFNTLSDAQYVQPTDILVSDPASVLTPKRTFGYHALIAGGPAIDAVSDGTCPPSTTDQRGVIRPQDGNGDGGPACDIGSYEFVFTGSAPGQAPQEPVTQQPVAPAPTQPVAPEPNPAQHGAPAPPAPPPHESTPPDQAITEPAPPAPTRTSPDQDQTDDTGQTDTTQPEPAIPEPVSPEADPGAQPVQSTAWGIPPF